MPALGAQRSSKRVLAAAVVLAGIVLGVDLSIPLGVAGGVPYVAVVLVSLWSSNPRLPIWSAIGCSILTGLGFLLSPAGGIPWMVFTNRFLALFAIWVTAVLGLRWRTAQLEMVRQQDRLAQVSRVNALGELASGIAHELNQPLSAILNYAEASSLAVRAGRLDRDELSKDLECISAAADRGGAILHRLRSLVANRSIERSPQDMNALVTEAISLLAHDITRCEIKLSMALAPRLPLVPADPIQIQQVVVNLVRNAIEAMEDSDTRRLVLSSSLNDAKEVEVCVADSGSGSGEVLIEALFEHFVTTKPNGLGVGLAISRSIVEAHGGQLTAECNPTRGMTFRFTVPQSAGDHTRDG